MVLWVVISQILVRRALILMNDVNGFRESKGRGLRLSVQVRLIALSPRLSGLLE